MKIRHILALTVLLFAGLALSGVNPAQQASAKSAVIVAQTATPSMFITPTGSDAGPTACAAVAPCKTTLKAYQAAPPDSVIQVGTGTYPDQEIPVGTKTETFVGQPNANLHHLSVAADNITLDGVNLDGKFDKIQTLSLEPVHGFVFKNASIGNVTDEKGVLAGGTESASDILRPVFDTVNFHDVLVTDSSIHNECFYNQASGLVVINSTFTNCATMDLFITRGDFWTPPQQAYGNIFLENNTFGPSRFENGVCCHYYGLAMHDNMGSMLNWTIRNNRFDQPVLNGEKQTSGIFCGNTGSAEPSWKVPCGTPTTTTTPTTTAQTTTAQTTTNTTTTTPAPPSVKTLLTQAKTNLLASNGYKSWAKANPGELSAINNYNAHGGTLPTPKTQFGQFYLKFSRALSAS